MTEQHKPSTKTYHQCPQCGCREEKHDVEAEGRHYCTVCGAETVEATYRQLGLDLTDEGMQQASKPIPGGGGRPVLRVIEGGAGRR